MNNVFEGVIIDPGHGGVDGGAKGKDTLEKDYNLLISRYMYDRFNELGIPVYITRDSDITLNPSDRVNEILSFFGDNPNVVVISNHLNAGGRDGCYCKLINLIFSTSTIWIMNSTIFIFKCMSI